MKLIQSLKLLENKMPRRLRFIVQCAKVLWQDIVQCDLFKHASAMAYLLILSIIPTLAAIFSMISLFQPLLGKESGIFNQARQFVFEHLATGSGETVVNYLEKFLMNLDMTKIGLTGFAGLIFSLAMFLNQIESALNRIWLVAKGRSFVGRFIYFWTFLTLGAFLLSLGIGVISGFNVKNLLPSFDADAVSQGRTMLQYFLPMLSTYVFFLLLYKVVPNCYVPMKESAWGAFVALVLFELASHYYGFYVKKFTSYQAVYGALAAVPLFIFWLYLNSLIILFGALFSWRLHQGFQVNEQIAKQNNLSSDELQRNAQLQTLLPLILLLTIQKKFASGEGAGYTGAQLAELLQFPLLWTKNALVVLEESGFVKTISPQTSAEAASLMDREVVPAKPAKNVNMLDLALKLTARAAEWRKTWHPEFSLNFEKIFDKLATTDLAKLSQWDAEALLQLGSTKKA